MLASRFALLGLLGLFLVGVAASVAPVHAQKSVVCERALDAADDQYLDAEYEEALRLVSACLNQSDIPDEQAVSAYRLLALIHLKQDELESARAAVVNLLGIEPTYEADPVNSPPAYVSLVSIVQRDLQRTAEEQAATAASSEPARTPFFRRTSTWITMGGILVGSGVATYFVMEGGGTSGGGGTPPPAGPGPLPVPPGAP
jgi:hypothetical protein